MAFSKNRQITFQKNQPTPRTMEAYIASLDPLLRKNTGQFTNIGFDTESGNRGFITPQTRKANLLEGGEAPYSMNVPYTPGNYAVNYPANYQSNIRPASASDFIKRLNQSARPQVPPTQVPEEAVASSQNGGFITRNGQEVAPYSGSFGATPMMTLENGRVMYSDGTIREYTNSPGFIDFNSFAQGVYGGQKPTVTQEFGNVNPDMGYNGDTHGGVDLAGQDSSELRLPIRGIVVQRLYDDGIADPRRSQSGGYGNSVLIRLENGEFLRFSHLADTPLNVRDVVNPNDLIGIQGSTGNSTGQHVDVEYLATDGRTKKNLETDFPYNDVVQLGAQGTKEIPKQDFNETEQRISKQAIQQNRNFTGEDTGDVLGAETTQPQPNPYYQPPRQPSFIEDVTNAGKEIVQQGRNTGETAINKTGSAFGIPNYLNVGEIVGGSEDTGFSEVVNQDYPGAIEKGTNYIAGVGKRAGLPEYNINETGKKVADVAKTASSLITGNGKQLVNNLTNTAVDFGGQLVDKVFPNVQASGGTPTNNNFTPSQGIEKKTTGGLNDYLNIALADIRDSFLLTLNPGNVLKTNSVSNPSIVRSTASSQPRSSTVPTPARTNIPASFEPEVPASFDRPSVSNGSSSSSKKVSSSSNKSSSSSKSTSSSSKPKSTPTKVVSTMSGVSVKSTPKTSTVATKVSTPVPKPAPTPTPNPVKKSTQASKKSSSNNNNVFSKVVSFLSSIFK